MRVRKKTKKRNSLRFVILVFFLFSVILAYLVTGIRPTTSQIILSDKGFSKQAITIQKGSRVTWKITGENLHWPASDIHPLHNNYPDGGGCIGSSLDACKPLKAGESFSFIFQKEGKWAMHDHLYPQLTMDVTVKDDKRGSLLDFLDFVKKEEGVNDTRLKKHFNLFSENQKKYLKDISPEIEFKEAAKTAKNICGDLKGSKFRERQHCYSEVFYVIAKNKDQKFAFLTLSDLQKADQSTRSCHLIAHGIGWAMFDKDPQHWKDAIGRMSPECSYGGIHGIVEQYSVVSGELLERDTLETVCGKNPSGACYHAIGHVLIVQTKNNLTEAIKLCEIFKKTPHRSNCLNGVFMEHMIGQNLAEHGFVTHERRKHYYEHLEEFKSLCIAQTDQSQIRSCWTEIIHAAVSKYKGDVDAVFMLCDNAQTKEASMSCRRHALAEILPLKQFEPFKARDVCKKEIKDDLNFERDCYFNLSSIAMSNAPYKINSVIYFCSSLKDEFRSGCFGKIKQEMRVLNSKAPERGAGICQKVPTKYKSLCI